MSIVESIQTRLDNREVAACDFVDLREAFDTVHYRMLISNPRHFEIRGIWMVQFLSHKQKTDFINRQV